MGFFSKLRQRLAKTKEAIAYKLHNIFKGHILDDEFYDELEAIFLAADMGVNASERILDELKEGVDKNRITDEAGVRALVHKKMCEILSENGQIEWEFPCVIMIVGVNGVGKTTLIGKLANYFKAQKKSVTVAAADTFRAAAADQLSVWADRADVRIIKHAEGADAAAVVFDALSSFKSKGTDVLLIDTAGRLHNKKNLMEELKKIGRVVEREGAGAKMYSLLVLDGSTGQNALSQTDVFNEAIELDGIVLTKLDGTAKGGIALAICSQYSIPVAFVSVGEKIDDLEEFNAEEFVSAII